MIDRGFTYYIPPFMIHGDVVKGVMSFKEMENMMYKIEGEDLYQSGTSEHSMIGKFIDTDAGDIILYQGNSITIYYDKNSWNFTRLARIDNVNKKRLQQILGKGNVKAIFSVE